MNKKYEYLVYAGGSFAIEWYFNEKGHSDALHYYESLRDSDRIQILKLFKRMGDGGEIKDKTKFMYEGDKIYAFKPHPDRFLCFFYDGRKIIVTNAFRKKQQKIPKNEKERALKTRNDYTMRVKSGEYYDK